MKSKTHSIGAGKKNYTLTLPKSIDSKLSALAAASELSVNAYMRHVVVDAVDRELVVVYQTCLKSQKRQ